METTIDFVKRNLEASRGTWPKVCADTGLDYSWLTKMAQGKIPNPGYQKIELLYHYFKSHRVAA